MTPALQLKVTLSLMEEIEAVSRPADAIIAAWSRTHRRLDERDRGDVLEMVQAIMRHHARLGWWLERHEREDTARNRLLAWLMLRERQSPKQVDEYFDGTRYGPETLTNYEFGLLVKLHHEKMRHPDMPEEVRLECPDWALEPLRARFGADFAYEMNALVFAPSLDLRVNTLKSSQEDMMREMKGLGLQVQPMPFAPDGIRIKERIALSRIPALKSGAIEIQDEGSQLVALLMDAKPGERVVDFCAGAGGKTLALAAQMKNRGHIIACDISEGRLKRAAERIRHAGVHNTETKLLSSESDRWVKRHKYSYDRVLVDAPCSGTGTWRRNPDARWRAPEEEGLDNLVAVQARILTSAARLVKPGGRLVYATCSLLPIENEAQVESFLKAHPSFRLVPLKEAAPDLQDLSQTDYLSLTPAQHDTDGFFAAVLERVAEPVTEATE